MIFLPERVLLLFGISTLILPIAVSDNEPPENGVNAEVRGVLADLVMEALHPPEVVKSGRITIEEWRGIRRERRLFDAAFKKWVDDHPGDRLDWGQTIHMQKIVNVRDMVQAKFFDESALVPRMRRYAHVFDGYHGDLKWGYKCLEPELCEIMNYRYFSVLFAWLPRDPIVNLTLVEQRVTDYKSKARARLASEDWQSGSTGKLFIQFTKTSIRFSSDVVENMALQH
ncbi:unnamed protein product, partial [Mesorhabditis spiculigera]